jgi:hypothetical protein
MTKAVAVRIIDRTEDRSHGGRPNEAAGLATSGFAVSRPFVNPFTVTANHDIQQARADCSRIFLPALSTPA